MLKKPEHAFIEAAHTMSHAAPEQWKEFVAAFDAYAQHMCVLSVQAHIDEAHVARGHARGFIHLHAMLEEIEARYRALREKKR